MADVPGLRPTPDRVRETLFNWLEPHLAGARCIDLFAGTGALGLEAGSRGAAAVQLVERDAAAAEGLRTAVATLGAEQVVQVACADACQWLARPPVPADIVFIDPPWATGGHEVLADRLESGGWLADDALIYLESDAATALPALPSAWSEHRCKEAGQVRYTLFARAAVP